jgi:predicted secreted protein
MVVTMTKLASIEFEFEYDDDLSDDEIREQFFDDLFMRLRVLIRKHSTTHLGKTT